ncbi:MAG: B12-binding domain-containing radical SAM protein [Candidatus Bathyarchaeota archaeon]|nr:B12-binding domain-containing radical SAM protein [Candidatus Bathyarchaeota archaeon]
MILLMTTIPPKESPWGIPARLPPLGLSYVAGALEKAGFEVQMLDNYQLQTDIAFVKQEVEKRKPQIVGITCGSVTYRRAVEMAKAIKEVDPSCKVVVGGWHASYLPESALENPEIDYAIMGEGERTMVELATQITKGANQEAIAKIPGVACRLDGKISKTPPELIEDVDSIPYPARHLLDMNFYDRQIGYLKAKPVDVMHIMRGCPYDCSYCETKDLWGMKCRAFSPERVIGELRYMQEKFGSKGIYFIDDNFTINKQRTVELCRAIKAAKLNLEWACDTRVDLLSEDLLREMREAGCRTIFFGIQSGVPRILEKLNTHTTLEKIEAAFKMCRKAGINIAASFMLGIPGETLADMEATYKFAKKLGPDWCTFYVFIACPTSRLYKEVLEKHLYDRMDDFLAFVKTDEFDYKTVVALQQRYQRGFNTAPKTLLRRIRRDGVVAFAKSVLRMR